MFPGGPGRGSEGRKFFWPHHARPGFWKSLFWRIDRLSRTLSPHHAPGRDGLRCRRDLGRGNRGCKRCYRTVAIGSLALFLLVGCEHRPQQSPQAVYNSIEQRFIAGELQNAREQATEAQRRFETIDPVWASVFRIELAKILIWQGEYSGALTLLQTPLPSHADDEWKIRQKVFLSLVQSR